MDVTQLSTAALDAVVKNASSIGLGIAVIMTAAINAMEAPDAQSSRSYRYWYAFLHGLPLPTLAARGKVQFAPLPESIPVPVSAPAAPAAGVAAAGK